MVEYFFEIFLHINHNDLSVFIFQESVNSIGGVNVFLPFFETDNYTTNDNTAGQSISLEDFSDMSDFAISNFRNVSGIISQKKLQIERKN